MCVHILCPIRALYVWNRNNLKCVHAISGKGHVETMTENTGRAQAICKITMPVSAYMRVRPSWSMITFWQSTYSVESAGSVKVFHDCLGWSTHSPAAKSCAAYSPIWPPQLQWNPKKNLTDTTKKKLASANWKKHSHQDEQQILTSFNIFNIQQFALFPTKNQASDKKTRSCYKAVCHTVARNNQGIGHEHFTGISFTGDHSHVCWSQVDGVVVRFLRLGHGETFQHSVISKLRHWRQLRRKFSQVCDCRAWDGFQLPSRLDAQVCFLGSAAHWLRLSPSQCTPWVPWEASPVQSAQR